MSPGRAADALENAEPTQIAEVPLPYDTGDLDLDDEDDRPVLALDGALEEDGPTDAAHAPRSPAEPGGAARSGPAVSTSRRPVSARAIVERAAPSSAAVAPVEPRGPAAPASRRLELPLPGGRAKAAPTSSATPEEPAARPRSEVRPPRPEPLPLPSVPEALRAAEASARSSGGPGVLRYGLVGVALVLLGIVAAFGWSARHSAMLVSAQRERGTAARERQPSRPTYFRSYKDEVQAANPELLVRSPLPLPAGHEVAKPEKLGVLPGSAPKARRRGGLALQWGFRQPGKDAKEAELRYGFEAPERPKKRDYETSEEPPAGSPPMLMIFTDPPGVAVDIDGHLMGVTPMLRPAPAGKSNVEVHLWGGAYVDQRFTLKKGKDGHFQLGATMESKPRVLPQGAPLREGWVSSAAAAKRDPADEDSPSPPAPPSEEGSK